MLHLQFGIENRGVFRRNGVVLRGMQRTAKRVEEVLALVAFVHFVMIRWARRKPRERADLRWRIHSKLGHSKQLNSPGVAILLDSSCVYAA